MDQGEAGLPDDVEALKALLLAVRADVAVASAERDVAIAQLEAVAAERDAVAAEVAIARAQASDDQATIAHLKLQIAKLKRDQYGPSSERSARLIDQLELQLEEIEASASEDDLLAEMAAARTTEVAAFTRRKPARKPFPAHLPRERIVHPTPTSCACLGARASRSWAKTSPRRWRLSPAPGR